MLVTALATPYKEGKIDCYRYESSVARQAEGGADALLCVGTTAEALLLSECEKKLLVKLAKGVAPHLPVWVGVEDPDTAKAATRAQIAEQWGADGILVAPPAFVKCTPRGYALHIGAIAERVKMPIMLYNAPGRCGYVLDEQTLSELSSRVRYLKDAGDDAGFTERTSKKMIVLCGNDKLLLQMLAHGAVGVVSVVSNVAPRLVKAMLRSPTEEQKKLFGRLAELSMAEINPIAVKYMLVKAGVFDNCEVRLPLTSASEATRKKIDEIDWEQVK